MRIDILSSHQPMAAAYAGREGIIRLRLWAVAERRSFALRARSFCKTLMSERENVGGGIDVAIMGDTALHAPPYQTPS